MSDIRLAQQETGIDLLAWARQFDPCIAVVLVTGFPEVATAVDALRLEAYDYLLKPVDEAALLHSVEQAAGHSQLLREKLHLEGENRRYQRHLEELVAERTTMLQRRTQQLMLLHWIITLISALKEEPTALSAGSRNRACYARPLHGIDLPDRSQTTTCLCCGPVQPTQE